MDGVACKLPGVISPPLNGAPEAATLPQIKPRISEGVQKLQLVSETVADGVACSRLARFLKVASSYMWTES